jgi:hypothetical protein
VRLPRCFSDERDSYVLGLLRVALATLLFLHSWTLLQEWRNFTYFGEIFHLSLIPEAWLPSRSAYGALLVAKLGLCALALLGLAPRPALLGAALLGLFGLACDRLQYHNNRYVLHLVALLVAFTPCDRSFLFLRRPHALPEAERSAPRWAAYLLGLQLSLVYLSSSLGKLLDADWRSGTVMLLRFGTGLKLSEQWLPGGAASIVGWPVFAQAASLAAIGTELCLAIGLWLPRTRKCGLWLGTMFHAGIELSAHVELFSYLMVSSYLVFVTPQLRTRRLQWAPENARAKRLSALLLRLDWLARFRHEQQPAAGPLLIARDRSGKAHVGWAAAREVAGATPLLFPLWLPLGFVAWWRREPPAPGQLLG